MGKKSWHRPHRRLWESEQFTLIRDCWYYFSLPLAILIVGTVLFWLFAFHLIPRYYSWQGGQSYRRAQVQFQTGQTEAAMISLRQALTYDATDPQVWQLAAAVSQQKKMSDEVYCLQQWDRLAPNQFDLQMRLAETALHYGNYTAALTVLKEVSPENQATLRFQLTAGALSRALKMKEESAYYLEQVRALHPTAPQDRLLLARWELDSTQPLLQQTALKDLQELRQDPLVQTEALRLLLQIALNQKDFTTAQSLNQEILQQPTATLDDRLQRLEILLASPATAPQVDPEILALQKKIEGAADLGQMKALAQWMASHGRPEPALIWIREQSEATQADPGIGVARADCLMDLGLWTHLRDIQIADVWPEQEKERLMILARACFALGEDQDGRAAWFQALLACQEYSDYLELLQFAEKADQDPARPHHWDDEKVVLYQRMLVNNLVQPWIVQKLLDHASAEKDWISVAHYTQLLSNLNASDKNFTASAALVALLLDQDGDKAGHVLEELLQTDPDNPIIATNAAFHFYQQGKFHLALRTLGVLPATELHNPARALYIGLLFSVAGPVDQAETNLQIARQQPHLMEAEKQLLEEAEDLTVYRRAMAHLLHDPDRGPAEKIFASKNLIGAPDSIFTLGQAVDLVMSGQSDAALPLLTRIDTSGWGPAETSLYLGAVLYLTGQTDAGRLYLELDSTLPDESNLEKQHHILDAWAQAYTRNPSQLPLLDGLFSTYRVLDNLEDDSAFWMNDTAQQLHLIRAALLQNQRIDAAQGRLLALQDHVHDTPQMDALLAYSLLLQGRTSSALDRMKNLSASDLLQPEPALFYGIILLANGQKDQARAVLKAISPDQLWVEEVPLLATTLKSL